MQHIKKERYEYVLMSLLFAFFVFGILGSMGTLTSGFHLVDDHEFITGSLKINELGFGETMKQWVFSDFNIRFRPLYSFVRIIGIYFMGTNTVAWSVCKAIEIVAAMTCFYMFARMMGTNKFFSIMFSMLILIGEQSAIWWRLGPQESLGILLFSMCLLATLCLSRKRNFKTVFFFIVSLSLLSLQKEAFCISMPGFFLLLVAFETKNNKENSSLKNIVITFLKLHLVEILIMVLIFGLEIYFIVFHVGTDRIGYAGFSDNWPVTDYFSGIISNFKHSCKPYLVMLGCVVLLMQIMQIDFQLRKVTWSNIFEILFCLYLFGSQQLLHAKSGMWERYLIPWVIAIFYFLVIMGYRIIKENKRTVIVIGEILLVFLSYFAMKEIPVAIEFADRGEQIQECIDYIMDNSANDAKVISVMRNGEEDMTFCRMLKGIYGYEDCTQIDSYEDNITELGNADILFGKEGQAVYRITEEAGLLLENYVLFETEYYEVAIKKESLQ